MWLLRRPPTGPCVLFGRVRPNPFISKQFFVVREAQNQVIHLANNLMLQFRLP